jgi:hypothetical protein
VPRPLSQIFSDNTQCPHCVAEKDRLGGGSGHADSYFHYGKDLWAVCSVHQVRWCVTRRLFSSVVPEGRSGQMRTLKKVCAHQDCRHMPPDLLQHARSVDGLRTRRSRVALKIVPISRNPDGVGTAGGSSFVAHDEAACVQGVSWAQARATITGNR